MIAPARDESGQEIYSKRSAAATRRFFRSTLNKCVMRTQTSRRMLELVVVIPTVVLILVLVFVLVLVLLTVLILILVLIFVLILVLLTVLILLELIILLIRHDRIPSVNFISFMHMTE